MKGLQPGDTVSYLTLKEKKFFASGASGGKKYSWVCDCICGQEVVRRADLFIEGKSMSCGCMHPSHEKTGNQSTKWKGRGDLSGQYFGTIRARAVKYGHEFTIDIEYAWELFLKQKGRCALTDEPLSFATLRERRHGIQQTASLDRINSEGGYEPGNVQWVHADVNLMKNAFPQDRFVDICTKVAKKAGYGSST